MTYIDFHNLSNHKLPFYLAAEEYVARNLDGEDYFFMWQVPPTVIFGRNQVVQKEVNLDYCRAKHIEFYRRKSGGGCVYADFDNIMFSYITRGNNVQSIFRSYTYKVADILRKLGIDAKSTGRNDILIGEKKVSGNAFYCVSGHSIVHGTMLYDTNIENMLHAITPSSIKLDAKGVESVRTRVTTLCQHISMPIDEFKQYVRTALCDSSKILEEEDIKKIREIEQAYYDENWVFGKNPLATITKTIHIEEVGELEVSMDIKGNKIKSLDLHGDFFPLADIDSHLIQLLVGKEYQREKIEEALREIDTTTIIRHLTKEKLINLLF